MTSYYSRDGRVVARTVDDRAVSPVVGSVLLVALAVLLAVSVSVTALGVGTLADPAPSARFSFAYEDGVGLVVTHEGGKAIPAEELSLVGEDPDAVTGFGPWAGSGDVGAGDSTVLSGVDGNEVVRVVWSWGDRSSVLAAVALDFKAPFAYELTDGTAVIEAEGWTGTAPGTGSAAGLAWERLVGTDPQASGDGYIQVPNADGPGEINLDANGDGVLDADGPRLDYRIDFDQPGTYYVHVRMKGASNQDDSVHVGLDGTRFTDASHATSGNYGMTAGTNGNWRWTDEAAKKVVSFEVTDTGVHTLNVEMREDGTAIDRVVVTRNPSFDPRTLN